YIMLPHTFFFFSFNDPATPEISTLSLHDALPIFTIHYPEHSLVNRHNRAMAAQMLASAARFGITGKAMLTGRKDDVREARKRRESLPVGRNESLPGQRNQRLRLRNA